MPDNGKVTLVRHDGTLLEATPEQASRLAILGYRPQTPEEAVSAAKVKGTEDYYTSAGQKLTAAGEGFAAGVSFGGSDYLFGDDETKQRAAYNPGTRLATEVLGAVVPMLMTSGASSAVMGARAVEEAGVLAKAAKFAPSNLLSDAARALAPGVEGSLTKAVTKGAIEGGVYGGAGSANHAYLDGEPITAEAILHGIGWGAVVGGALSSLGHGAQKLGEHEVAVAARKGMPEVPHGALKETAGAQYQAFKGEVDILTKTAKEATAAADASVSSTMAAFKKASREPWIIAGIDTNVISSIDDTLTLYNRVGKAVNLGKFQAAREAADVFTSHVDNLAKQMNVTMASPKAALDDLILLRAVAKELRSMPGSVEGFAQLTPQKFERVAAALEQAKKLPLDNASLINDAAAQFSKALGIEQQAVGDIRSTWKAAKSVYNKEGVAPTQASEAEREASFGRKILGYALGSKAYVAARSVGVGHIGSYAAYRGVKDAVSNGGAHLASVRAGVQARVRSAAANYLPGAGKAGKALGPKLSYLSVDIFGKEDKSSSDKRTLAYNRVQEIANFAPTAGDTIFRAVEPLSITQPQLAPAMHAAALTSFGALYAGMPKDPGAISRLKSIWRPSDVQAAILNKQLEVFHDPIGVAERMLQTGKFDAIRVKALKDLAPSTWQDLRLALLERITQPDVMDKMSYNDQVGLSTMLDLAIHSSMNPGYIATSQQLFLDRNQPLASNPRMGQSGGMPNPQDNVGATASQRTTER